MSSRPADQPTWATDANYPAGGNGWNGTATKVEPVAGKQAEGFEPIEKPPAQYLNWWMNLVYLWIVYFADGDIDLGDIHVQGSVRYSSTIDVGLDDGAPSVIDPLDAYQIRVSYTAIVLFQGAIIGLSGGVHGREVVITNVNSNTSFPIIHESASAAASERISMRNGAQVGGLTLQQKDSITLRYEGSISRWVVVATSFSWDWFPNKTFIVPGMAAQFDEAIHTRGGGYTLLAGNVSGVFYPVGEGIPDGSTITGWTLHIRKNTANPSAISARLHSVDADDDSLQSYGVGDSDNSNSIGYTTLAETGLSVSFSRFAHRSFYLNVSPSGSAAPAGDRVYALEIHATTVYI